MKRALALMAAVFLWGSVAAAQARRVYFEDLGTVLSVACDGTLTTTAFKTEEFGAATLSWALTDANASASTVTATCVGTGNGGADAAALYKVPVIVGTGATGTVNYKEYTYSYAVAGSVKSQFTVSALGNRYLKCTFACGGAAADSIAVSVTASVP